MMSRPTTDLRDFELSVRRTVVPAVVGIVLAQAARANLTLPAEHVVGLVEAVFITVYYATVRLVEQRVPQVGLFLGAFVQPKYVEDAGE
jgi:hypothetical protein